MNKRRNWMRVMSVLLIAALIMPFNVAAQDAGGKPAFKQEELEQLLAPIALYPDSLLTQILMASTYPLEVVQADRWAKQNKSMKGDALTKALEAQPWDPSVKSLVNFPNVLTMMSEKLDLTQKLGDAFLAQQKDVMNTIQKLRAKAKAEGNLKTTKEQVVKVEQEVIIIESASPQVVYVPTYNPTVVYGAWAYPSYPPYPYYPYGAGAALLTGVAIGAAWGYAWGNANWRGGDVDIDVNRNTNINNNINRQNYQKQMQNKGQVNQAGKGSWKHDAGHRGGVAYRDQATAQKHGQSSARTSQAGRDTRGYSEGRGSGAQAGASDRSARTDSGKAGGAERGGSRDSAFSGSSQGGFDKQASDRGQASRSSSQMSSGSRGGGGASAGGMSSGSRSGGGSGGGFSGGSGGGSRGGGGGGRGGGGRR